MRSVLGFMPLLLTASLAGCATFTGDSASPQEEATTSLSESRQLMDQLRGQIDRTAYSLESMVRAPSGEIRTAQQRYADNVDRLSGMVDQLDQSARALRAQRINYLTEWERAQFDVENKQLKQAAEQRQQRVTSTLADAEASLRAAQQAVVPLVAELRDVEQVSDNDPTPAGIAAIKKSGILQSAQQHANAANRRLDLAASRFDSALAALSPQPGTRPVGAAGASPGQGQ